MKPIKALGLIAALGPAAICMGISKNALANQTSDSIDKSNKGFYWGVNGGIETPVVANMSTEADLGAQLGCHYNS